ncbi:MAG: sodium:calcium antiporter, partial [Phycisphaerae bacterium]|nr:sodium:calcium antiporter [Phycisphaerae bacterium]
SLPEIVTSFAAVKLGNVNLALGNIFGSNMFNIFVLPFLKIVSVARGDALLMHGADFGLRQTAIAGLLPILLTSIAMAGLTYGTRRRFFRFGVDSVLIAVVYCTGMVLLLS